MTYNTNTEGKMCDCCNRNDIEGQWWYFSGYSTGTRLVSGYYCPQCSDKVYKEREKHNEHLSTEEKDVLSKGE